MNKPSIINITPQNVLDQTLFCIKDLKNPGFQNKKNGLKNNTNKD